MQRGRKKKSQPENSLLTALKFISVAQKAIGSPEQTYCKLNNGFVIATNSILSAAHPITEDISCCPHTFMFIEALEQAKGAITLTILDAQRLQVRAGEFQAVIPCIDPSTLPAVYPDTPIALADDRLKEALFAVGSLAIDGAQKIVNASVRLTGNDTALSSDGTVILEAYHGIKTYFHILPKTFITGLQKVNRVINKQGMTNCSFTLWFDESTWIKTQTYPQETELPNLLTFLNIESNPSSIPTNLFEICKRLQPFSDDGQIYFDGQMARVTNAFGNATENIDTVPPGISLSIAGLLKIEKLAKTIHFNAAKGITIFFGDNLRGAIATNVGI